MQHGACAVGCGIRRRTREIRMRIVFGTALAACLAAGLQYFRRREWTLGVIAFVQVVILAVAMSGLVVAH